MTDRTVAVRLRADVSDYAAKLGVASRATSELASKVDKAQGKAREGYHSIGVGLGAAGALVVGGFIAAGREMANFESRMALVKTLSHATAAEMQQLRAAAMTAGQAFGFNADQVADAEAELVKAGVSVKDIIGGALTGALTLAAAGQEDVAAATETAAIAMTQFKLSGKDVPHIADLLAAGADKAIGSVHDLSMGLQSGGLVAAQFGLSIDDTIGTLSEFAQAGLMGERGGTTLRQMLLQLTAPSKQAADIMEQLGINVYDAGGRFVGMSNLAGQLHDKLGGAAQATRDHALAVIFGAHAIQGANVLVQDGAAGWEEWRKRVDDSGFAALQAAGKMDSLSGDATKLKSALQNAFIGAGENANGPLRTLTQDATEALNTWNRLPGPVKTVTEAVILAGGAATLAGGAALLAVPKWTAMNAALVTSGRSAITTRGALVGLGKVGGVALAIGAVYEGVTQLNHALNGDRTGDINGYTNALLDMAKTGVVVTELQPIIDKLGEMHGLTRTVAEHALFPGLDKALSQMVTSGHADLAATSFGVLSARLHAAGLSTAEITKLLPEYASALADSATSAKEAGNGVDEYGNKVGAAADQTDRATKAAKDYNDQLHAMADPVFALGSALSDLHEKQTAVTKAVKDHGAKSRQARDAQLDLAQSALSVTDASTTLAGALRDGTTSASGMRDQLRTWVKQGVITKSQADAIATSVHGIIKQGRTLDGLNPKFTVDAKTAAAQRALEVLKRTITNLPDGTVVIHTVTRGGSRSTTELHQADGGYISGPGGPRDDLIPAWLSNGEYVMPAASTRKYMPLLDAMRAGKFADGGVVGYAAGGKVTEGNVVGKLNRIIAHPGASAQQIQAAIDAVAALSAAWANTIQAMQTAAEHRKLVKDLSAAQTQLRHALSEHGKGAAADVKAARTQVADAKAALADFNEQRKQAGITARLEAAAAALAEKETLRANKESWRFEHLTAQQQVDTLTKRMAGEKAYSAAWLSDAQQREQIEQSIADAAAQAAQQRQDALDQAAAAATTLAAAIGEANTQLADATKGILDTRTTALAAWADLTQQVSVGFAPSMKFLINNAKAQAGEFVEWMAQLASARSRGVSEAVIKALKLDEGPQSLAQLRQINAGSADQVAQLNGLVDQRTALAATEAQTELAGKFGDVGVQLVAALQANTDAITKAQSDYQASLPGGAIAVKAYDTGGVWPSGTLGVNMSGHDEWVSTGLPTAAPVMVPGDFEVRVFIGDRELTDIVDTRITRRNIADSHQRRRVLAT